MKTIEIPASNRSLRQMVKHARRDAVVLTDGGKPVAALVSIEGVDTESAALGTNPKFLRILRSSYAALDRGERLSLAEMRKRVR